MIIGEIGGNGEIEHLLRFPIPPEHSGMTFPMGFYSIALSDTYPTEADVENGRIETIRSYVNDNICNPIQTEAAIIVK